MTPSSTKLQKPSFFSSRQFIAAAVFSIFIIGAPLVDAAFFKNRVYPGVQVGNIKIGSKKQNEASALLQTAFDSFRAGQTVFTLGDSKTDLRTVNLVEFDIEETHKQALQVGKTGNILEQLRERFSARSFGKELPAVVKINQDTLHALLTQSRILNGQPQQNASFVFTFPKNNPPEAIINEGAPGIDIDFDKATEALLSQAKTLTSYPISLTTKSLLPSITKNDLEKLLPEVIKTLEQNKLEVFSENKIWPIPPETIAQWLQPTLQNNVPTIDYDPTKIALWLEKTAEEVEQAPANALFELSPDEQKVIKFEAGKNGIRLPREENIKKIREALVLGAARVELTIIKTPPQIANAAAAEKYGIKELVGHGETQFKGSPPNRIKNIKRGADMLYGVLIAPGENFSLLEHLRPFTLENGYLPELVIKAAEGRTVSEIGGGLCQIGTTAFRVALNTGLPITSRYSHYYRVGYYEPPVGMDATIYDPAPDFKFINDTGNWMLLTTYTDTKKLTVAFDLWGTRDGRVVNLSEPQISNLRAPPPRKMVETTTLPVGKIRCTEQAHTGADVSFTYKVTYPDAHVAEKIFQSKYKPWQEVCLIGVEQKTADPALDQTITPAQQKTDTLPSADSLGVTGQDPAPSFPQN